jgi:hypothetical protein
LVTREDLNEGHIEKFRIKAAARPDGVFEFGIGFDYGIEIGLNTVFAKDDTEWVRFSGRDQLHEAQNGRGVPHEDRRLKAVADDISSTAPPFAAVPNALSLTTYYGEITPCSPTWGRGSRM